MPELTNPNHEAFALAFAVSNNASAAYRKTYGEEVTGESARSSGARLMSEDAVRERVSEIRKTITALRQDEALLTMLERRTFLALVVRTPIGEIDQDSALCQSWKKITTETGGSVEFKMPDKLSALELDAKLAGELTKKVEHSGGAVPITLDELRARVNAYRERVKAEEAEGRGD